MKKTHFLITLLLLLIIVACGTTPEPATLDRPPSAPTVENNAIATRPAPSASQAQSVGEPSASGGAVRLDMDQRMAIFETLWETVNEEYVDPKFNGVNWKKMRKAYAPRVKQT